MTRLLRRCKSRQLNIQRRLLAGAVHGAGLTMRHTLSQCVRYIRDQLAADMARYWRCVVCVARAGPAMVTATYSGGDVCPKCGHQRAAGESGIPPTGWQQQTIDALAGRRRPARPRTHLY